MAYNGLSLSIMDLLRLAGSLTGIALITYVLFRPDREEQKLDAILEQLSRTNNLTNIITKNVIGGHVPEKFYEIDGRRFYLEIDGKPVEEYFKK